MKRENATNPEYMAEKKQREDREAETFKGTFAAGANELKSTNSGAGNARLFFGLILLLF